MQHPLPNSAPDNYPQSLPESLPQSLIDPRAYFLQQFGLTEQELLAEVKTALMGCDDGELFCELRFTETLSFNDGKVEHASYDQIGGFGLRGVVGELTGYAHSSEWSRAALRRAAAAVKGARHGYAPNINVTGGMAQWLQPPQKTNQHLYGQENPIELLPFAQKIQLLKQMESYAKKKDSRLKQFSGNIGMSWQAICILRADGSVLTDIRPLARINMSVLLAQKNQKESGSYGYGGRGDFIQHLSPQKMQHAVDEALRAADVNLNGVAAPAGETTVVLGPGWTGILLHEAVGHGLEGDFNRKGTSAFTNMLGQRVAANGVTVVDDGTIEKRRGSLNFDDEGTPTNHNILIEDGILKGYMQDRQNARLMQKSWTGNCRRESYAHVPMPRMTNTFMLGGQHDPNEIIGSVKRGVYAVNFGGGQVDITNGKFVFSCTESYEIENGKIGRPLKGATLIGNGPESLKYISMIGNDLKLDSGIGTCGKNGQGVPVGVGQPTIKLDKMVVGGTRV